MTQTKAQTVAAAIIGAGYSVNARVDASGSWTIVASAVGFTVAASVIANHATNQGVIGNIQQAEFS